MPAECVPSRPQCDLLISCCPHPSLPPLLNFSNYTLQSIPSYPASPTLFSEWLRVSVQPIVMPMQGTLLDTAFKNLSLPSSLSLSQLDTLSLSSIMSSFIPSVKALSKAALTYSQIALLSSSSTVSAGSPETCSSPQTSCQNTSVVANTCCFNAPGGQLLQVRRNA